MAKLKKIKLPIPVYHPLGNNKTYFETNCGNAVHIYSNLKYRGKYARRLNAINRGAKYGFVIKKYK